ncbi:primosomal protein N' [Candidatus Peregrinibacteria bacterium]|nr:primosomal protein N' [Candidatus Peregrinibacteria bacterium]
MSTLYAEVIPNQKIGVKSSTLTYKVPDKSYQVGQLVEIPLRKGKTKGLIFEIKNIKPNYPTKSIIGKIENTPELQPYQIELIKFISNYYLCPLHKVLKLFIPSSFFNKKNIKALADEKIVQSKIEKPFKLNQQQQKALEIISKSKKRICLLHGITGSGKTEIYRQLTDQNIKKQQQVLILIPEISLTPQTVNNFERKFGKNIAIIHSKLTPTQKEKFWKKIHHGELNIIIGSRSAIFAPFINLGKIIIDEEHEDSYKQEQSPRYNTQTIAEKIAEMLDIQIILGSATPSIENYYKAKQGEYELIELTERAGMTKQSLPPIKIVDMREELKKRNFSIFSHELLDKLTANLQKFEQSILFLNRRGAASAIICRDCGHVEKCPNCQIAYTYHSKINLEESLLSAERMICHHCGKIEKMPKNCSNCSSISIKYIGIGTQKVEDETKKAFPNAILLRADKDTTKTKNSFEEIYQSFKKNNGDILIGTQMIGKGLHIPGVTLVGIMLADTSLTIPDYRSSEKAFQLFTQVAGRSGREKPGIVIIQTYMPDHPAIKATLNHDYLGFYNQELSQRQEMGFPPFSKLVKLTIEDKDQQKAYFRAQALSQKLETNKNEDIFNINVYPALIPKLKNKFRWIILLSGKNPQKFIKNLHHLLENDIKIDVDPKFTV